MTASPQTQVVWARLEDALREWGRRDPARRHRRYEQAAEQAVRLCGELARTVEAELGEYRERAGVE